MMICTSLIVLMFSKHEASKSVTHAVHSFLNKVS